jgi:hypothetical protein
MFQDGGDPAHVGVDLNLGPGIAAIASVLSLDPDKGRIAGRDALPDPRTGMVAAAGGDHMEGAVTREQELRQRAGEIGATIDDQMKAGRDAERGAASVVAQDPAHGPHLGAATFFPARLLNNIEPRFAQGVGQP